MSEYASRVKTTAKISAVMTKTKMDNPKMVRAGVDSGAKMLGLAATRSAAAAATAQLDSAKIRDARHAGKSMSFR
jgi:hypothetical protein